MPLPSSARALKKPRLYDEVRFLRSWIEKPLHMGAVMPSGKLLARTMAHYVDIESDAPVVELGLKYRSPARFDDELDVETTLGELRVASLRFDYRLVRVGDGTLCAEASTRLACVNDQHELRRFTPEVTEVLTRGEQA